MSTCTLHVQHIHAVHCVPEHVIAIITKTTQTHPEQSLRNTQSDRIQYDVFDNMF